MPTNTDQTTAEQPLVVLVDDLRSFADRRRAAVARTSVEALTLLTRLREVRIDQLWLDHDLGGDDTVMPVVTVLEEAAFCGRPYDIGVVVVHTSNPAGASRIMSALQHFGYVCRRVDAAAAGLIQ